MSSSEYPVSGNIPQEYTTVPCPACQYDELLPYAQFCPKCKALVGTWSVWVTPVLAAAACLASIAIGIWSELGIVMIAAGLALMGVFIFSLRTARSRYRLARQRDSLSTCRMASIPHDYDEPVLNDDVAAEATIRGTEPVKLLPPEDRDDEASVLDGLRQIYGGGLLLLAGIALMFVRIGLPGVSVTMIALGGSVFVHGCFYAVTGRNYAGTWLRNLPRGWRILCLTLSVLLALGLLGYLLVMVNRACE